MLLKQRTIDLIENNNFNLMSNSAPDFNYIYFYDKNGFIYLYDNNLDLVEKKKLKNAEKRENFRYSAFDINGDKKKELIYQYYNGLTIYGEDLNQILKIKIDYPRFRYFSAYKENNKHIINFKVQDNLWYTISIFKNKFYKIRILNINVVIKVIYFGVFHEYQFLRYF